MNKLINHFLRIIFVKNTWLIVLFLLGFVPYALVQFVPLEESPTLFQPAYAQASWIMLWVVSLAWLLFQHAQLGNNLSSFGLGEYLQARGIGRFSQLAAFAVNALLWLLPCVVLVVLLNMWLSLPSKPQEQGMWIVLNWQYASLLVLVVWPLSVFAASLATRFGAIIGFVMPASMAWFGFSGLEYLLQMNKANPNAILQVLISVSPHYYLANPLQRMIFKLGALPWDGFAGIALYLGCFGLVLMMLGCLLLRPVKA